METDSDMKRVMARLVLVHDGSVTILSMPPVWDMLWRVETPD